MSKLTAPMKRLIENYTAGAVATVNDDGTPAVSPKATFVLVDDKCIAFGNIRSPATVASIEVRPHVEVNFIDVLTRRAVRVKGTAQRLKKDSDAARSLLPAFQVYWAPYIELMDSFVAISIVNAEIILSPAYDVGHTAAELRQVNLSKLSPIE
jgi:hypothetical protein